MTKPAPDANVFTPCRRRIPQAQAIAGRVGVPDPEKVSRACIRDQALRLSLGAVARDELKRVDVALVDATERKAAVATSRSTLASRARVRLRAEAGAACVGRNRRREQA